MTPLSLLELNSLSNPLLLISSDKDLNRKTAFDLAKKLVGPQTAEKIDSGNHPDLHLFALEEAKSLHTMESMQQLIYEMNFPAFEAPYAVFIIEDIEKMLSSSMSALLKTLEEPIENCFIIALTTAVEELIPTILSRLCPISLESPPKEGGKELLPLLEGLFSYAAHEDWAGLMEPLEECAAKDQRSVFEALLLVASKDERLFPFMADLVEEGQVAMLHGVKMHRVLLHILLSTYRLIG